MFSASELSDTTHSLPPSVVYRATAIHETTPVSAVAVATSFSMGNLEKEEVALAGELVGILTRLGPTFVKLGQLISSRADLISVGVAGELGKLQSDVAPFSSLATYQVTARIPPSNRPPVCG